MSQFQTVHATSGRVGAVGVAEAALKWLVALWAGERTLEYLPSIGGWWLVCNAVTVMHSRPLLKLSRVL